MSIEIIYSRLPIYIQLQIKCYNRFKLNFIHITDKFKSEMNNKLIISQYQINLSLHAHKNKIEITTMTEDCVSIGQSNYNLEQHYI